MSFAYKYAPKTLEDVVLGSNSLKAKLADYINGRDLKPLILHGGTIITNSVSFAKTFAQTHQMYTENVYLKCVECFNLCKKRF